MGLVALCREKSRNLKAQDAVPGDTGGQGEEGIPVLSAMQQVPVSLCCPIYPGGYWTPLPVLHKPGVETRASDVQGQPQLQKELGASLGYMNPV